MCGGDGTRLAGTGEKPLLDVGGEPMIDRVLAGIRASEVETVHAAVSPATPETRTHLADSVHVVETPGEGYVADLRAALETVPPPVVTVVADLPLLAGEQVDDLLAAAEGSTRVVVPTVLARTLGCTVDHDRPWLPAGLNFVADDGPNCDGSPYRSWDARLAVNVNRQRDRHVAEELLDGP
jgi:adenosylcobinamide-phosphate guanylyltransferase